MARLTVVGFASGSPASQLAMARVASEHRLLAVVMPQTRGSFMGRFWRSLGKVRHPIARLGVPIIESAALEEMRPDLILVASYPQILSSSTLTVARVGALNMHMSLLPRHRGIDPIFWTYWDNDENAGVTVHWMNDRIDAGGIAAQECMRLERGFASRELYTLLASRGVELLAGVLKKVAAGNAENRPQDETRATHETAADIAQARIPVSSWPAERVWHVLSGLGDQRDRLLADRAGAPLKHGRATGYRITAVSEPGRVAPTGAGYEVHCRDGIVQVARG